MRLPRRLSSTAASALLAFHVSGCSSTTEPQSTTGPSFAGHEDSSAHRGPTEVPRVATSPLQVAVPEVPDAGPTTTPMVLTSARTVELRALVLSGDGTEPGFAALKRFLATLGIPYDAVSVKTQPFAATMLRNSDSSGKYAAIFLATDSLQYLDAVTQQWVAGLNSQQLADLHAYEARFDAREVRYYGLPSAEVGLSTATPVDTTTSPTSVTLTSGGKQLFPYVNSLFTVPVKNAYSYPSKVLDPTTTTPLIVNSSGGVLAATHIYPDGHETLVSLMDNNSFLVHSLVFQYGIINWAFHGRFPGERHVYLSEHIDDLFIDNDMWAPAGPTPPAAYRITGAELTNIAAWQSGMITRLPTGSFFKIEMAFNGAGAVAGAYPNDTLTPAVANLRDRFFWVSHTWDHENLDLATADQCTTEITKNATSAVQLGLPAVFADSVVTPDISGLQNAACLGALFQNGIRFAIGNTSIAWMTPANQNVGLWDPYYPSILIVPRHPTNLFYNVKSPEQWLAEYNSLYHTYFGKDLTYPELLNVESDIALQYMLGYDIAPLMFHQPNLATYSSSTYGKGTTLGDWTGALVDKYSRLLTLPIKSVSMHEGSLHVAWRMNYDACGVRAMLAEAPNTEPTLTLTSTANCVVPITGVQATGSGTVEQYGGQPITWVNLKAGTPITMPAR